MIEATIPLLRTHGRFVTTKDIASAAGVAEGTIFRVFSSKDELVDEAIHTAFAPGQLLGRLASIDRQAPLRERLIVVVTMIQSRLVEAFDLMRALALVVPPERDDRESWQERFVSALREIVGTDGDLRVSPEKLVTYLRLLTFAGSHSDIVAGPLLTPDEIVDVILDGTRKVN